MPKTILKVRITNPEIDNEITVPAIIQDGVIKYKEDEDTTVKFIEKNKKLVRENHQLRLEYKFDENRKTKGIIFVKEIENNLELEIETKKYNKENNNLEIEFLVENDLFLYRIEEIK